MTDPKETDSMTTDSLYCRRCSTPTPEGFCFGVLAAKHDDPDPRFRTRVVGDFSSRHSGPYCRSCAYDRQHELKQQDRRSAKRNTAQKEVRNVESDDCTLVAMAACTKRSYATVKRAARKAGYRPNSGGMSRYQQELMASFLGFRFVSAFDGGSAPRGLTVSRLQRAGLRGRLYCRILGHAFPMIDGAVKNQYRGSDRVISVHTLEKI